MILALDITLLLILVVTAWLALSTKDLLTSVALLSAYSLFAALLFAGLQAVDVALVEAALGAGLTGVLFIVAILATTRRADPRLQIRRRIVVTPLIIVFLGLMLFASTGLPDRGDPQAPGHLGISTVFLSSALEETNTPNVVTALLADYRSMDTLGETLVILTASLSATLVLLRRDASSPSVVLPGRRRRGATSRSASGDQPEEDQA
ncbi:MAG: hydrogen gas-evolving membrane-bound hydrogenase subunit E [Nitriliruptoraceae bacterium]